MTSRCQGLFPPHLFFKGKALGTRLPIIALHATEEQIVLTEQSRHNGMLFMKRFYNVVNCLLLKQTVCFAKEDRASIVLIIE